MADIPYDVKQLYKIAMDFASTPDAQKIINSDPSLKQLYENMVNHPESDASILFMSSLSSFFEKARDEAKKNEYLKQLKTLVPELDKLTEERDKVDAEIDSLRMKSQSISQEIVNKMNEFTKLRNELIDIPGIKSELLKIPNIEKYINITSAQARRIGRRVAQEGAMALSGRRIINPINGEEYRSYAAYADQNGWPVGKDSAARVVLRKQRYPLIPATEENEDLVNNCIITPPCVEELQGAINMVQRNYQLKQEPSELTEDDILAILRKYKH